MVKKNDQQFQSKLPLNICLRTSEIQSDILGRKPMFSIIMPTYNRANMVMDSIQSVLNQEYRDFELIIVDDGSTDETEQLIKRQEI